MSKCGLEDFKLKLDQFLTKVPGEPKGEGLIPGDTNPFNGRQTNSLVKWPEGVPAGIAMCSGSYMDQHPADPRCNKYRWWE